jgi:AraC-like DNA-binding protein
MTTDTARQADAAPQADAARQADTERQRLTDLLDSLASAEGLSASGIDEVQFMRATCAMARAPVVYESGVFILGQGRKIGYLGGEEFVYDAHNYLVLPVALPFECTTEALPGKPVLGMRIDVDPMLVGEVLLEMDDHADVPGAVRGVYSTPLTPEITGAAIRLLEVLKSPVERRVLGRQIVREIIYRVLCGEQSAALRAIAMRHSHVSQISKALRRIHQDYARTLDVETLAREAGMSVSTFHANFKTITSTSPLQYLKSIRLHKARALMVQDGLNAGVAAREVGYESASQFSREFKRFFGDSPARRGGRTADGADQASPQ